MNYSLKEFSILHGPLEPRKNTANFLPIFLIYSSLFSTYFSLFFEEYFKKAFKLFCWPNIYKFVTFNVNGIFQLIVVFEVALVTVIVACAKLENDFILSKKVLVFVFVVFIKDSFCLLTKDHSFKSLGHIVIIIIYLKWYR